MAEYSQEYGKKPLWQWVLIYLVVGGLIYGLIYYFVWGKKGGYSSGAPTYNYGNQSAPTGTSMSPSPSQAATHTIVVPLAAENSSGESGTATLEDVNGKVVVTVALNGFVSGVSQPAHLHVGACPGVGAVKYPLTPVVNGASVTTLNVTLADLKSQLPLALNVHKSASEVSVYTACGLLAL